MHIKSKAGLKNNLELLNSFQNKNQVLKTNAAICQISERFIFTFQDHVMLLVTWPFDWYYAISYRWSTFFPPGAVTDIFWCICPLKIKISFALITGRGAKKGITPSILALSTFKFRHVFWSELWTAITFNYQWWWIKIFITGRSTTDDVIMEVFQRFRAIQKCTIYQAVSWV